MMEFGMAVASAGPYANNLHLTPDRQPHSVTTRQTKQRLTVTTRYEMLF